MKIGKFLLVLTLVTIILSVLAGASDCYPIREVSFRSICFGPSMFITNIGLRSAAFPESLPSLEAGFSSATIEGQKLNGVHFGVGYPSFNVFQGIALWGKGPSEYDELKLTIPLCPRPWGLFPYLGAKASALSIDSGERYPLFREEYSFLAGVEFTALPGGCPLILWAEAAFLLQYHLCGNGCSIIPATIECGIRVLF